MTKINAQNIVLLDGSTKAKLNELQAGGSYLQTNIYCTQKIKRFLFPSHLCNIFLFLICKHKKQLTYLLRN